MIKGFKYVWLTEELKEDMINFKKLKDYQIQVDVFSNVLEGRIKPTELKLQGISLG